VNLQATFDFIKKLYQTDEFIPLHAPVFAGNEKLYLNECIDSTFVSYVGSFVSLFEEKTARHISTTAKVPHRREFLHDETGYNYRMTNVSSTIGLAQMERISDFFGSISETSAAYAKFFEGSDIHFFAERDFCTSNYWLNVVLLTDHNAREEFLKFTNDHAVMTRPIWTLMNRLGMFDSCSKMDLSGAEWLEDRVVNIPSSIRLQ
jgi:perosamine synthetase